MLRFLLLFCAYGIIFTASMTIVEPGAKYPPTKGEVWPKPQYEQKQSTYFTINLSQFEIKTQSHTCTILTNAIGRFPRMLAIANISRRNSKRNARKRRRRLLCASNSNNPQSDAYQGVLRKLEVDLTAPCEDYPHFDMDESYNLTVTSVSKLTSGSIWGIIRGLETFAQLFYLSDDNDEIRINGTEIYDYPQYTHRGLLVDTSRHYISLNNILLTLDAMAMNKMNVFHWHIVDDQSFPYQSEKFPSLSDRGAYQPLMIYTKSDMERVIQYAKDRGIRVLPEFDVPGHTRSWGVAYPDILTECYQENTLIGLGPMNPIKNNTYKLLRDLFQEVQEWFPDRYFHIGGDEVDTDCWASNPELLEYMLQNNMSSVTELHALFMRRAIPLLAQNTVPIVWQEVFDENVPLSPETLVQVWKYGWTHEMDKVLLAGHRVLFSSSWYLDSLSSGGDWEKYYNADPRQMINNDTLAENIAGGEACMWGEVVDDSNIISRVWPRASAVAERLWSAPISGSTYSQRSNNLEAARHRLEEHVCRMKRRGVRAQPPNGPGFCPV